MRILVIGCRGQVGFELSRSLLPLGAVVSWGREEADLSRPDSLEPALEVARPDLIVNAAAYTAVDAAEADEATAMKVNCESPGCLSAWAGRRGVPLVHYSTDYVFPGAGNRPWRETDAVQPLSAYGRSKAAGEEAVRQGGASHVILRTSWVYGSRGHNFLRTMIRLAQERDELRIVDDQVGAPTWSRVIAETTAALIARAGTRPEQIAASFAERGGTFHLSSSGETTWFEFARSIFAEVPDSSRKLQRLVPIRTDQYPTAAKRPAYSVLDNARLRETWNLSLPSWLEGLRACVEEWQP